MITLYMWVMHVHQLEQIIGKSNPLIWYRMRTRALKYLVTRGLSIFVQIADRRTPRFVPETGEYQAVDQDEVRKVEIEYETMGVGRLVLYMHW